MEEAAPKGPPLAASPDDAVVTLNPSGGSAAFLVGLQLVYEGAMSETQSFATLQKWADARIDMRIECACGRTVNVPSNQILVRFGFDGLTDEAADRLRCKRCGERGKASMVPVFWATRRQTGV